MFCRLLERGIEDRLRDFVIGHGLHGLFQGFDDQQFITAVINDLHGNLSVPTGLERRAHCASQVLPHRVFELSPEGSFQGFPPLVRGKNAWETWKQRRL
jgi:hypothetical protein